MGRCGVGEVDGKRNFCFSSRRGHTRSSTVFFVFRRESAYEIEYGLVGSEMCIKDSLSHTHH